MKGTVEMAGYRPIASLGRWLGWLLGAIVAVDIIALLSGLSELSLLQRLAAGELVTDAEADANDSRQALIGMLWLVAFLASGILFIVWFHRAYKNLRPLGADGRFRTWWAIVGWFVPLLRLWRPKQIVNDIWRGTDPNDEWRESVHPLLWFWWAAFLSSAGVDRIAVAISDAAETLGEITSAARFMLVSVSLDAVAAVLALAAVRMVTARQKERARNMRVDPFPAP